MGKGTCWRACRTLWLSLCKPAATGESAGQPGGLELPGQHRFCTVVKPNSRSTQGILPPTEFSNRRTEEAEEQDLRGISCTWPSRQASLEQAERLRRERRLALEIWEITRAMPAQPGVLQPGGPHRARAPRGEAQAAA